MTITHRLVPWDSASLPPARELASIHSSTFPHSPATRLGIDFLERFYYTVLPRQGFIFGAMVYIDDQLAGFISATDNPFGFMNRALRKNLFYLAAVLLCSVIKRPANMAGIWDVLYLMSRTRKIEKPEAMAHGKVGEILSLAMLPPYRVPPYSRLGLAGELLDYAVSILSERDVRHLRVVVDKDNLSAQFFYHCLGWTMTREEVPGWRCPSVQFDWDLP